MPNPSKGNFLENIFVQMLQTEVLKYSNRRNVRDAILRFLVKKFIFESTFMG